MEITTVPQTLTHLLISLLYGVVTVIVAAIAVYMLDHLLYKQIDFLEEIKRGNMAAAVFYASLLLFVGLVVTLAIN